MFRTMAVAAIVALTSIGVAVAQERCRWDDGGAHYTQWFDQEKYQGARIVSRDARWMLDKLGWHATSVMSCPTCADDQISQATLWLGAGSSLLQDLEGRVSPESVAIAMGPFPFSLSGADFRSTTKSISVTIDGLEGFARAISIQDTSKRFKDLNGRYHVIALALAKDCLSLFGILSAKDAADIPIDRVQIFGTALRVELYTAEPPTAPAAAPKQDELLLLGDERRRAEEQRQ